MYILNSWNFWLKEFENEQTDKYKIFDVITFEFFSFFIVLL